MSVCMFVCVRDSPKAVDNQLSSIEFRGLASDCFCHHRTTEGYMQMCNSRNIRRSIIVMRCMCALGSRGRER